MRAAAAWEVLFLPAPKRERMAAGTRPSLRRRAQPNSGDRQPGAEDATKSGVTRGDILNQRPGKTAALTATSNTTPVPYGRNDALAGLYWAAGRPTSSLVAGAA